MAFKQTIHFTEFTVNRQNIQTDEVYVAATDGVDVDEADDDGDDSAGCGNDDNEDPEAGAVTNRGESFPPGPNC